MSTRRGTWSVIGGLIVILLVSAGAVAQKEHLMSNGELVLLELAPVDPRSLMSGDYMRLEYALHDAMREETSDSDDGHVVVRLGERGVGTFVRRDGGETLAADERRLRYRRRSGGLKVGPDAFHFQEGHAAYYEGSRYGAFRVSESGALLLVGLCDADLNPSGPPSSP
jgi:uncharacterized membrane-anchored protein